MKILIDTNVILDVILQRSPFDTASYKVLKSAEEKIIEAYIASFAVTDLYYFISKNLGNDKAALAIKALLSIVKLIGITNKDVEKALRNPSIEDLEDALQAQCARKVKADYIITRDDKLKKLVSNAISPLDFVEILNSD
ncbi:PIN domain-containing protein [Caldicoprobacter algeriensis]|uniref:type II toxin-antitoxin system VapC family toxin n=1 Tax=Caldicoprobacter algeriensis TaxID=699281 RepID=UPI002079BDED|nr:PIN domain-containing protein [Caldicoprobacter algeriensis]MCM8901608.1 PIN domain-containing protein [Caldicoprobacter algeriensis]